MLYIVATPIGNLDDITLRALNILKNVKLILAENILHSKKLLQHYVINTKLESFNEHNEKNKIITIIDKLTTIDIALISDAGTPTISDPGYNLVKLAKANNIKVCPVPGVSAVITSLCASGLPSDSFSFFGFIPTKINHKVKFIRKLQYNHNTAICFESPKRILNTLQLMQDIFATDREICLAKELTKQFEKIITAPIANILNYLIVDDKHQKGEFVLLISPNKDNNANKQQLSIILPILKQELPAAKAAKIAAKITGLNKKYCYEQFL